MKYFILIILINLSLFARTDPCPTGNPPNAIWVAGSTTESVEAKSCNHVTLDDDACIYRVLSSGYHETSYTRFHKVERQINFTACSNDIGYSRVSINNNYNMQCINDNFQSRGNSDMGCTCKTDGPIVDSCTENGGTWNTTSCKCDCNIETDLVNDDFVPEPEYGECIGMVVPDEILQMTGTTNDKKYLQSTCGCPDSENNAMVFVKINPDYQNNEHDVPSNACSDYPTDGFDIVGLNSEHCNEGSVNKVDGYYKYFTNIHWLQDGCCVADETECPNNQVYDIITNKCVDTEPDDCNKDHSILMCDGGTEYKYWYSETGQSCGAVATGKKCTYNQDNNTSNTINDDYDGYGSWEERSCALFTSNMHWTGQECVCDDGYRPTLSPNFCFEDDNSSSSNSSLPDNPVDQSQDSNKYVDHNQTFNSLPNNNYTDDNTTNALLDINTSIQKMINQEINSTNILSSQLTNTNNELDEINTNLNYSKQLMSDVNTSVNNLRISNLSGLQDVKNSIDLQTKVNSDIAKNTYENKQNTKQIADNTKDIKDALKVEKGNEPDYSQITQFAENVKGDFDTAKASFDNAKDILSGNFNLDMQTASPSSLETTVMGHNLSLNLCDTLSIFRPFVTILLSISLLIASVRIYFYGFTIGNGGK